MYLTLHSSEQQMVALRSTDHLEYKVSFRIQLVKVIAFHALVTDPADGISLKVDQSARSPNRYVTAQKGKEYYDQLYF